MVVLFPRKSEQREIAGVCSPNPNFHGCYLVGVGCSNANRTFSVENEKATLNCYLGW